uniref:Uncharacterized protein n=1 Tax=Oryza nivara TaxID=4536 RepID=A0A0E0FXJ7_ORYNI
MGRVLKFETVETNNFREENDNLQKQLSLQENQVSRADAAEPRDIIKSSVTAIPAESSKNAHNKGKKPEGEKAEEQGMSATRKGMTHINNIAGPVIILNRQ